MVLQKNFQVATSGRSTVDITRLLQNVVEESGIESGLCNAFIQHTSASLIICENADEDVRRDLETFMHRLVPDGDPSFLHAAEGPDDMPAHVRSILTQASISLPVVSGRLGLGTWQGVYLWEHRTLPHRRHVTITISG
ncbi:MAG: secondary thiamine-phosphate synthase enzyme YjbQ [Gammaproteobacteria bacterium]|jgi:secondary thiamine-phosphate synthase enzyme